ncbi:MAG: extracellular solute-binding protein [Caldilineaceae bacterium]|nr:extracellular solute-binding protein [Caldilineaceae bacterium]
MHNSKISRRSFLQWAGAGSATLALAACAPAAAPGADTGAASGGEAAPAGDGGSMSVATFDAVLHDWQREFAKRWADAHPEVDVQIESVVYGEMAKLQLARAASGTMWDLVFSGIKWFPFSASKDMFLNLDDFLANREDANLDDFFATALEGGKLDGTLYGLPYEIHPGNPALVAFNVDMLDAAGLSVPQDDDWTVNDYAEMCVALTKPEEGVWGTNYLPGNYYDFESIARAFNTDIMNEDRTQLLFATDEANRAAAEWITKLRTDLMCAPNREAAQGLDFTAGAVATAQHCSCSVNGTITTVGDNFALDFALFPKGPEGYRGYTAFTSNYSVSATTADPDMAVDLLIYLTSEEAGTWSALEQGTGQPNARRSVWENEELLSKSHPIFRRVVNMYNDASIPGPFPMPSNLRFSELQDNWANTSPDLFYGDVGFEEGLQAVQDAMQEILDLPRA